MYINPDSDLTLILRLTDRRDEPIRVSDMETLTLTVYTDDRNAGLRFGKSDIESDDKVDRLFISADELALLGSGVVAYEYRYTTKSDPTYTKVKTVYTNFFHRAEGDKEDDAKTEALWDALDRMRGNMDRLYDRHDADVNDIRSEIDAKCAGFATHDEVNAVADERYTKTEVDGLLSGFASGFDDMKSEVDAKLSEVDGKVDGALSTIDSRFEGLKVELTENYYDKSEIDSTVGTLNGNIESLRTDFAGKTDDISTALSELEARHGSDVSALTESIEENKSYVDAKFDSIDFTPYLTKSEAAETYLTEHQSLEDYYMKSETYSTAQIDEKIASFGERFAGLESDVESKISEVDGKVDAKLSEIDTRFGSLRSEIERDVDERFSSVKAGFEGMKSEIESKLEDVDSSVSEAVGKVDSKLSEVDTKFEDFRREVDEKVDNVDLSGYYKKTETYSAAEIDERIRNVDVTGQLAGYAKIWFGTYASYNGLDVKDPQTIYVIKN